MIDDEAEAIWNRACDPSAGSTHPGDAALAAVLLCHGMAMNGGLLHAVEGMEADQRERAVAGYRLLGLDAAAVGDIARSVAARAEHGPTTAEDLEEEADRRYDEALPEWDETVVRAFRAHLRSYPEAYAPVQR